MGKIRCHEYHPQCLVHLESTRQAENFPCLRILKGCVIKLPVCPERESYCSQICKDLLSPGINNSGCTGTPVSATRAPHSCLHVELNWRWTRHSYFWRRVPSTYFDNPLMFSIFQQHSCSELKQKKVISLKRRREYEIYLMKAFPANTLRNI